MVELETNNVKLLLLSEYPPIKNFNFTIGPEKIAHTLIKELSKYPDMEIHLITMRKWVEKDEIVKRGENIYLHYLSFPKPRIITNLLRGTEKLMSSIKSLSPDLIHSHGDPKYSLPPSFLSFPWVHTIHGVTHKEKYYWYGRRLPHRFLYPFLEKASLRKCRYVISICEYVEKEYSYLKNTRFFRIPNLVSPEFFSLQDKEERPLILYIGSISYRKDPLMLVKSLPSVVSKHPKVKLHIIGRVENPSYFSKMNKFIKANDLSPFVEIKGVLNNTQVREEISRCSLLVLPSRQETSPLSIAEAMAAGKPVIATRVGGIPEMVEDGKTGFLITPGDWKELAEKILILLKNDTLRKEMGSKGREKAKKLYHPETVVKKLMEVYNLVLNSR